MKEKEGDVIEIYTSICKFLSTFMKKNEKYFVTVQQNSACKLEFTNCL